jgi:MarR family transcriptional regulator, negative regulator of the multidrug operon emrRAB
MLDSFKPFEAAIDQVGSRVPGQPRQEVLLYRLYYHVFQGLIERLNHSLTPHDLNATTWFALIMIYSSPDNAINPSDLSCAIASSRTNITRVGDELVSKGWVARRPCEEDRRRVFLTLTPEGSALVERVLPIVWDELRQIWGDFTPAEKLIFEQMLRKLLAT